MELENFPFLILFRGNPRKSVAGLQVGQGALGFEFAR